MGNAAVAALAGFGVLALGCLALFAMALMNFLQEVTAAWSDPGKPLEESEYVAAVDGGFELKEGGKRT